MYFIDNKFIYSVDLMYSYVNNFKQPVFKIPLSELLPVLNDDVWMSEKVSDFSPMDVINNKKKFKEDYEKIIKSDLSYPIFTNNDRVVDGFHRISKAYLENKKNIKAINFDDELMKKFIVGKSSQINKVNNMDTHDFITLFYQRFCV